MLTEQTEDLTLFLVVHWSMYRIVLSLLSILGQWRLRLDSYESARLSELVGQDLVHGGVGEGLEPPL